jgi:hypothetical protein
MFKTAIDELHKCIPHVKERGYFPPSTLDAITNHELFSRRLKDGSVVAACAIKQTASEEVLSVRAGKYTMRDCIDFVLENDDVALSATLINEDPCNKVAYFAVDDHDNYTATIAAMAGYLNKIIGELSR